MRLRLCVIGLALLLPQLAQAQPIIFERGTLRIGPQYSVQQAQPQAAEGSAAAQPALSQRPTHEFTAEIRSEEALQLDSIPSLASLQPNAAVMVVFREPIVLPLFPSEVATPLDVLFISADGTIQQIIPNLVLNTLTTDIYSPQPVKAFVYLQAGTTSALGILPQDRVEHELFQQTPVILQ